MLMWEGMSGILYIIDFSHFREGCTLSPSDNNGRSGQCRHAASSQDVEMSDPVDAAAQVAARLAGVPERADWKKCAVTPIEEEARTAAFKELFKPYDIMQ